MVFLVEWVKSNSRKNMQELVSFVLFSVLYHRYVVESCLDPFAAGSLGTDRMELLCVGLIQIFLFLHKTGYSSIKYPLSTSHNCSVTSK